MKKTMKKTTIEPADKPNLLIRALFMVMMGLAYYVAGTVILIVMVIQFVMVLLTDEPNDRLVPLGRSLGSYLQQIVAFLTFATEEKAFPFSDWPSGK